MKNEYVRGKNKGKIQLYALSTCIWCKKTKELLNELGVEYYYIFVDLLNEKDKDKVIKEIKKWNPNCSYPTLVINDKNCIVGYKEDEIKQVLGL
jgi:glutaredoxin-like protein NrdH